MKVISFILFIIYNQFGFSQNSTIDTIYTLKAKNIKPSIKKYIQYTEKRDGVIDFNSILTREIKHTRYNNNDGYLIIQKYQSQKSIDIDSSIVNSTNLKPLAYHTNIASGKYKEIVEFLDDKISNKIIYRDSTKTTIKTNKSFYNSVIMVDLVSELPLKKDKVFIINSVNPGLHFFEYKTKISVHGLDYLRLNDKTTIKCWKVNVSSGENDIGSTHWYSYSKKDRMQIKSVYEFDNGNKFIRRMIL